MQLRLDNIPVQKLLDLETLLKGYEKYLHILNVRMDENTAERGLRFSLEIEIFEDNQKGPNYREVLSDMWNILEIFPPSNKEKRRLAFNFAGAPDPRIVANPVHASDHVHINPTIGNWLDVERPKVLRIEVTSITLARNKCSMDVVAILENAPSIPLTLVYDTGTLSGSAYYKTA